MGWCCIFVIYKKRIGACVNNSPYLKSIIIIPMNIAIDKNISLEKIKDTVLTWLRTMCSLKTRYQFSRQYLHDLGNPIIQELGKEQNSAQTPIPRWSKSRDQPINISLSQDTFKFQVAPILASNCYTDFLMKQNCTNINWKNSHWAESESQNMNNGPL